MHLSSAPSTPRLGLSRRNSCTTFSVSTGLASMLNERGIKAVTPSALNTPCGPNYSPTVTPCNSPEGTPPREHSPEPPLLTGLLYSGADMLRRKFVGNSADENNTTERTSRLPARNKVLLSRQEKRALRSLRLVEKVESIGLDNIIHSSSHHHPVGISPLALGSRSRNASPMTQLTSLKNISHQQRRADDLYAVDRETIRAVLNKGLSHDSDNTSTDGSTTSSVTHRGDSSDSATEKRATVAATTTKTSPKTAGAEAPRTPQKTDSRVKQMQRQKSRRSLMNGNSGQRPDLGTVGVVRGDPTGAKTRSSNNSSNRLGSTKQTQQSIDDDDQSSVTSEAIAPQQTITQSFVGSISSLFFGRKGGLS